MRIGQIILAIAASLATVVAIPLDADGSTDMVARDWDVGFVNTDPSSADSLQRRYTKDDMSRAVNSMDRVIQAITTTDPAAFAKQFVQGMHDNNPEYNFVICRVMYTQDFKGNWGVDWLHEYFKWGSYTWDVIIGGAGAFSKLGNGGDDVWAYKGKDAQLTPLRKKGTFTVIFGQP